MQNKNFKAVNGSIMPMDLFNNMSILVRSYIDRLDFLKNEKTNKEKIIKCNNEIKSIEKMIFNHNYQPIQYTFNDLNLSDDEKRIFILIFILKTDTSIYQYSVKNNPPLNYIYKNNLTVGMILNLMFDNYSERIINRKLFSTGSVLVSRRILSFDSYEDESIVTWEININQRYIDFILGDNNTYASSDFIKIEESKVSFDSVILEESYKKEIINSLNNYETYLRKIDEYRQKGIFEYGASYSFMFYGPSGTGKTMLAHAIAGYLNKKLITYKDDSDKQESPLRRRRSSGICSKLAKVFLEASLHKGILFFDECSELFVHDSPESRELLIQLEQSNVIVIFATNRIETLSPALDRRILFKYKIKTPNLQLRKKLWHNFFEKTEIKSVAEETINCLSELYNMSGGFIKNAVLKYINAKISGSLNEVELDKIASEYYCRYIESSFALKLVTPSALNKEDFNIFGNETIKIIEKIIKIGKTLYTLNPSGNRYLPSINVIISADDYSSKLKAAEYIASRIDRAYILFKENYQNENCYAGDNKNRFKLNLFQIDDVEDIADIRPILVFEEEEENANGGQTDKKNRLKYLIDSTKFYGIIRMLFVPSKFDKNIYEYFNPDFILNMNYIPEILSVINSLLCEYEINLEEIEKEKLLALYINPRMFDKLKKILQIYSFSKSIKKSELLELLYSNNNNSALQLFG
ncbi:AAA family ATPase [Candidatus Dependentiae bacterium]|nr:AAA family ATPase [Candidatus Dependentiae bacterium]